MLTYNSASFFGRNARRTGGGRRTGVYHAAGVNPVPPAPVPHAAALAAPAPGLPVKVIPITDETVGEDAVMIANDSIRDHLASDPENISIVYKTGRSYRVSNTRRSDFTRLGNNLYMYECKAHAPNGFEVQIHHTHTAKLADLSKVGLSIGGGFVDMSRGKFSAAHRVYFLEPTRRIQRTADHRFLYGDGAGVVRCQANSGGQVYDLYPAQLSEAIDLTAFGRRRRRQ